MGIAYRTIATVAMFMCKVYGAVITIGNMYKCAVIPNDIKNIIILILENLNSLMLMKVVCY